ncbi:MAG TPA: spore gernimation protein [Deltaproteobacteria bacterium]|nr:MAG: hypothetical protein A2Z79_10500 [Deltaproteobacteria bacterium GWA2_55_82]OGQ62944.1 MAG: hypothetical protein A3I81_06470 [Deltaproteobacteria bacterium RIFCSPLOWO2_02_FULL_55_12]OIJ72906.1 MAG: hypothetical protein A2V21_300705 [Deltaproteobacteria bacterium GWC2_55_46]HBG46190.1 spore gernimation protein [Deltaproteobacteria bacterium]HCY11688.1 spore gernimation protein [Deltaproteobacteria bacterium]
MAKRKKSKKGIWTILAIAAATVIIGIIILVWLAGRPTPKETKIVAIYFSDNEGLYLKPEKRSIDKGALSVEARAAIEELLEGPENTSLGNTLPDGTRLLSVTVEGQTATVDLSKEVIQNHPGGSSAEILTIYSIVNTLSLNFPEIKDVQVLVEGQKRDTIAGHIDVTQPLAPDKKIIKS